MAVPKICSLQFAYLNKSHILSVSKVGDILRVQLRICSRLFFFFFKIMVGGGLPHMLGVLIYCAGQWQPPVILYFLRACKRRTPVDPRVCCWKKRIWELTNTHHWNNQCFSIPTTFSPKHTKRESMSEARPLKPASLGLRTHFMASRYLRQRHWGTSVSEGDGCLCQNNSCSMQPAFSYTPGSLYKKGCWLDDLSANLCAQATL